MTEYYLEWWQKTVEPNRIIQGTRQRITDESGNNPTSQENAIVIAKYIISLGKPYWFTPYVAKLLGTTPISSIEVSLII